TPPTPSLCPCLFGAETPVIEPRILRSTSDTQDTVSIGLQFLLSIPEFAYYYQTTNWDAVEHPVSSAFNNIIKSYNGGKNEVSVSKMMSFSSKKSAAQTPISFVKNLFEMLRNENSWVFEKFPEIYSTRYYSKTSKNENNFVADETHVTVDHSSGDLQTGLTEYFQNKIDSGNTVELPIYLAVEINRNIPQFVSISDTSLQTLSADTKATTSFNISSTIVIETEESNVAYEIVGIIAHDGASYEEGHFYGIFKKHDNFVIYNKNSLGTADDLASIKNIGAEAIGVLLKRKEKD
ncbi:hypothetical protein ENBRE01_1692, partial [Enteropsectra breve]